MMSAMRRKTLGIAVLLILASLGAIGAMALTNSAPLTHGSTMRSFSLSTSTVDSSPETNADALAAKWVNGSAAAATIDDANRTFSFEKYSGTTLFIQAIVTSPVSASGLVKAPNGTVFVMKESSAINGSVTLSLTIGPGPNSGGK